MTPLLIAAEQANFGLLKYLAETKNCDLNAKNKDGAGVVHLAAQAGDVVLIQYLQSKCLSIDESDVTGCKPLDYAQRNSN
jgi:ankyrin repeat protein